MHSGSVSVWSYVGIWYRFVYIWTLQTRILEVKRSSRDEFDVCASIVPTGINGSKIRAACPQFSS